MHLACKRNADSIDGKAYRHTVGEVREECRNNDAKNNHDRPIRISQNWSKHVGDGNLDAIGIGCNGTTTDCETTSYRDDSPHGLGLEKFYTVDERLALFVPHHAKNCKENNPYPGGSDFIIESSESRFFGKNQTCNEEENTKEHEAKKDFLFGSHLHVFFFDVEIRKTEPLERSKVSLPDKAHEKAIAKNEKSDNERGTKEIETTVKFESAALHDAAYDSDG